MAENALQILSEWFAALTRRLRPREATGPAKPHLPEHWMLQAVTLNQERRALRHAEAAREGAAYLVECRDLWDAHDEDAGVYFAHCATEADVTTLVNEHDEADPNVRILGIYSVRAPIAPQGPGLTRAQWLAGAR